MFHKLNGTHLRQPLTAVARPLPSRQMVLTHGQVAQALRGHTKRANAGNRVQGNGLAHVNEILLLLKR
jgi:hypothetical protein